MPFRRNQIYNRERLSFRSADDLRAYYEQKYAHGGYGEGIVIHGVPVSRMYHDARFEAVLRLLGSARPGDVLDAGCGNGALTMRLAEIATTVTAVDIAENACSPGMASVPNILFRQMNVEELSFAGGSFDAATCVETLEHLLHPTRALRELHRVLRPGGHLVITYPTINQTMLKHLLLSPRLPISEHLNEWSLPELRARVGEAGFKVCAVEGIAFDFGYINALKRLHRAAASGITRAALAIRNLPSNSMFVAMLLQKAA